MASAQDKIKAQEADVEQDETDPTAEKAKEIGKELGVKEGDDGKEALPDYEVTEEEDTPLAKEREPKAAQSERKGMTNKEKRDLRKRRVHEKFQAKDAVIERQQRELQAVTSRLNEFEGRLSNVDRVKVDEMLNQAIGVFNQAEKDHMEAFKEGDGEKATKAMRMMYESQKRIDQLQPIKEQYKKQPDQRQPPSDAPDPVVVMKAAAWADDHNWYKADGSDEDSEIAKAISGKLVNEGYNPRSDDFWDELDERLEKRGIGVKDEDEDDESEEAPAPKRRASPPVGGGVKRGDVSGKVQVTLPTVYVQHLKDKGWWDDPVMKKKMIGRYLETQKTNQGS